jgi:hypothetical protein
MAVPAAGYQVSSLVVDGVSAGALASYTFSGVTANHTISAAFVIIPGCPSLKLLRLHVVAFGPDMKNNGLLNSLLAKLDAAQASIDRGNFNSFQGQLGAFINELQAQSGKGLPAKTADTLIAEATALLTSCR